MKELNALFTLPLLCCQHCIGVGILYKESGKAKRRKKSRPVFLWKAGRLIKAYGICSLRSFMGCIFHRG